MTITAARKPRATPAPLFAGQSTREHTAPLHDDFVCDLQDLLRHHIAGIGDDTLRTLGAAIRERWGGDKPYIARRPGEGRSERNAAIRREYRRGDPVPLLMRRHNVSRVTVWRVLGQDVPGEA